MNWKLISIGIMLCSLSMVSYQGFASENPFIINFIQIDQRDIRADTLNITMNMSFEDDYYHNCALETNTEGWVICGYDDSGNVSGAMIWPIDNTTVINQSGHLVVNGSWINDTIDARASNGEQGYTFTIRFVNTTHSSSVNCSAGYKLEKVQINSTGITGTCTLDTDTTIGNCSETDSCTNIQYGIEVYNCSAEGSCSLIAYDSEINYITNCSETDSCSNIQYGTEQVYEGTTGHQEGINFSINHGYTFNAQFVNTTYSLGKNCTGDDQVTGFWINGTEAGVYCSAQGSGGGGFSGVTIPYGSSGNLTGEESKQCTGGEVAKNITISDGVLSIGCIADINTMWPFQTLWFSNSSGTLTFNENKMNDTISALDTNTQLTEEEVQDYAWNIGGGTQTHITVTYQDGTDDVDFVVSDDWWDADGDISADEISESKINFATTCGAGNHLYVSGNDLGCEADDDTQLTEEEVEDYWGEGAYTGNTETRITVTYQDADGTVDFVVDDMNDDQPDDDSEVPNDITINGSSYVQFGDVLLNSSGIYWVSAGSYITHNGTGLLIQG